MHEASEQSVFFRPEAQAQREQADVVFHPGGIRVDIKSFALLTYSVPAARVRAHLPSMYELQTYGRQPDEHCLVTTTCFCNEDFRPALLRMPRLTFNEITYRTYVAHRGREGVYFFGRFLGSAAAHVPQRVFARDTYLADFDVSIQEGAAGIDSYVCRASSPRGETSFSLRATGPLRPSEPFDDGDEMALWLTVRLHGFYAGSLGVQGHMPVGHPYVRPYGGELSSAYLGLWEELEVLDRDEMQDPHSVLVVPEVPFVLHPPRPLI